MLLQLLFNAQVVLDGVRDFIVRICPITDSKRVVRSKKRRCGWLGIPVGIGWQSNIQAVESGQRPAGPGESNVLVLLYHSIVVIVEHGECAVNYCVVGRPVAQAETRLPPVVLAFEVTARTGCCRKLWWHSTGDAYLPGGHVKS